MTVPQKGVLPARASLENLRNQAKTLQKQHRAEDPAAVARVAGVLPRAEMPLKLHDAQFVLAREYGFTSWPKLVEHVEGPRPVDRVKREDGRVWIDGVPRLRWGANAEPTYLGALEAAFRSSARALDLTSLMGDSGLCFRMRWATKDQGRSWCGSGPCGEWPEEVSALNAATGYVFAWDSPPAARPFTSEHVQRIVEHIDRGWPILAFIKNHDMGVIYGYEAEGRRLLVSDYWASEEPCLAQTEDAKEIGLFLQRIDEPVPRARAAQAGLALAVKRWHDGVVESETGTRSTYYYGTAGYARWIADLERADSLSDAERGNLFFLNGWTYSSFYANRGGHAARYLRANAAHFSEQAQTALEAAASCYDRLRERLGGWDPADPTFGMVKQKKPDTWSAEVRERELSLLRDAHDLDGRAIGFIAEALGFDAEARTSV